MLAGIAGFAWPRSCCIAKRASHNYEPRYPINLLLQLHSSAWMVFVAFKAFSNTVELATALVCFCFHPAAAFLSWHGATCKSECLGLCVCVRLVLARVCVCVVCVCVCLCSVCVRCVGMCLFCVACVVCAACECAVLCRVVSYRVLPCRVVPCRVASLCVFWTVCVCVHVCESLCPCISVSV